MLSSETPPPVVPPDVASTVARNSGSPVRIWALAITAGLLAGIIAWAIGEATLMPEAWYESKKDNVHVSLASIGIRNGMISFGVLGAAMGMVMGVCGGWIGRSALRAALAGVVGLLLGGGVGVALSWWVLPIYYEHATSGELTYSLLVHCGIWAAAGGAAGLAFAIGVGRWPDTVRGLLGGACAALLAAVIYEVAGGLLFPNALTDRPISQTVGSRLLARLLVTLMVSAGAVLSVRSTGDVKITHEPKT